MFSKRHLRALPLLSALLCALPAHAAPRYQVTVLPGNFSPAAINNAGVMAGTVFTGEASHAAVLANGKVTDLGTLGGSASDASAINDAGEVAGTSFTSDSPATLHAFVYSHGRMVDIDGRGPGSVSLAYGINARGQVVGQFQNRGPHAFLYEPGRGMRDLGTLGGSMSLAHGINDAGDIVGESDTFDPSTPWAPSHPFLYRNGVMRDIGVLRDGEHTIHAAERINNAGMIAGYSEAAGGLHVFLYQHGMMTDLGHFGRPQVDVKGINQRGMFVGTSSSFGNFGIAFVYADGGLHELDALIASPGGWHISDATGINDHGQIVGMGCRADVCGPVRLDPVPGQR